MVIIYRRRGAVIWNWTSKVNGVEEVWLSWIRDMGSLENWTIFMGVIFVSSLKLNKEI